MSYYSDSILSKIFRALKRISIVALAVVLFSVVNKYFIGIEYISPQQKQALENEAKAAMQKKEKEKLRKLEQEKIEKKKLYAREKKKADKIMLKRQKKKKEKDKKIEIVKVDDAILADLLTPLPDGTTKVQLYAETLDSSLGPIMYFNQSDYRWAKFKYGNSSYMYSSGCGPTIMAMVVNTFNPKNFITPKDMAEFAYSQGCYVKGGGSTHDIVRKCANEYDIPVKVIRATQDNIVNALNNNKLLVALVGKGEFTKGGHFILITGLDKDGKLRIADSISIDNTHKSWDISFIINQLKKAVSAGPLWEIG